MTTVSQGGEIETSQSSFSQGRVSYLGGVVISYILIAADGGYLHSGNEHMIKTASYKRSRGAVQMKTGGDRGAR